MTIQNDGLATITVHKENAGSAGDPIDIDVDTINAYCKGTGTTTDLWLEGRTFAEKVNIHQTFAETRAAVASTTQR